MPFTRRHVLLSAEGKRHLDYSLSFNWSARVSLSFRVTRDGQAKKEKKSIQRYQRDMARLEKHLQSKRLVCIGSLEVPSGRLSCCRKPVHEECLLKWFVHSEGRIRTSCPHCKQSIFPFNLTEGPPLCIPLVFFPFAFTRVHFAPLQPRSEDIQWRLLNPRPIPEPTPGWADFLQHGRATRAWEVN